MSNKKEDVKQEQAVQETNPYQIGEHILKPRPTNLRLKRDSLKITNAFREFALAEVDITPIAPVKEDYPNEEDYKVAQEAYLRELRKATAKIGDCILEFILRDEDLVTLRELFDKFFEEGESKKVDFTSDDNDYNDQIIAVAVKVLTDFFTTSRNLMSASVR